LKGKQIIKKVLILIYVLFLFSLVSPVSAPAITQNIGEPAPDFKLEDLTTGEKVSLSELKGKPVLMTFWATWCPRCWEEIDYMKARFEGDSSIVVLLVNMETQSSSPAHLKKIRKKADEHDIKFPMLLDKKLEVWDSYGVNSLPSTVIVDAEGNIAFSEANFYFASRDNIEEVIKKLKVE
jgi:peroxiredoxin